MKVKPSAPAASHVVSEDRFKLLPVTNRIPIRDFVTKNGITFAPGRGFYQLTKPETIQAYKEIVAVRISDGLQVSGHKVRELLKIPRDAKKFKYTQVPDFEVFVQSTSYNRVLMPGTKFLYEVSATSFSRAAAVAHSETRGAPPPPSSVGSIIDLVFSFDTTGSMYSCLDEVRKNLQEMITRILTDIPNIRIAVFAHGDYCDSHTYVTKHVDFTQDKNKLVKFVKDVEATGGGDFPECYELVLKEVREKLTWHPGSQRAMVMIGDAIPHSVREYPNIMKYYKGVKKAIDWRQEAEELLAIGCRIYAVQCHPGGDNETSRFWQGLAFKTYGHHLSLSNFSNVFDFIMAIAYREQGSEQLEAYKQEVIKRTPGGGLNADLHALFDSLAAGEDPSDDSPADTPVDLSALAGPKRKSTDTSAAPPAKRGRAAPKTAAKPKSKAAAARKAPASKAAARKAPASKAAVRKAPASKAAARKAPASKAAARKAPASKAAARKAPASKAAARKAPASKAAARKAPASKAAARKAPASKAAARKAPAAAKSAKGASKSPKGRTPAASKSKTKKGGPKRK